MTKPRPRPSTEPADRPPVRVTICPSVRHDPRVQLSPEEAARHRGVFATLGIGRYLKGGQK